ncbi:MAG: SnoaL-like domain-containing protein [Chlorobiaceae bacterium]|nr:SnoaL-like domain-containing protein [Chlorobiaceae bacterium]
MHYQNAEDVLSRWISGICNGTIDEVEGLYHENAVLIPTFSPHTVNTTQGIRQYFDQLATRDKLQVRLYDKSLKKQSLGGNAWVLSGMYAFEFEVDQLLLTFPSRFTFAVDLAHEKPIVHHHSSQVPRNLS